MRRAAPAVVPAAALALAVACGGAEIPTVSSEGMEPEVGRALETARAAVESERRDPARWGRFGMVLHAHGLSGPAAVAYAEAARLDEEDHRWPHLHGRLLEAGAPDAALALADEALRRRGGFAPALALRARVLDALGEREAAAAGWEALERAAPNSVEAPLALGRRQLEEGRLEEARLAFERVVERRPDAAAGWSFLAQVRQRLGEPEAAAAAASRARRAALGPAFGSVGDPDPLLTAVLDLRADRRGREARARRAAAAGDHGGAEAIYRRLLDEGAPDDGAARANLHTNHANALARLGRAGEAEAAYREALERDPDSRAAMANLANLLARTGRDQEAGDLYRRSLEIGEHHLPTLLGLSSLHFQRGNLRQAERFLREALALDAEHPAALQGLGQLLASTGRLDEAASVLARALAGAEGSGAEAGQRAGLHFLLADVERQRGRRAEALAHLARAEELGMTIPPAFRTQLTPPP